MTKKLVSFVFLFYCRLFYFLYFFFVSDVQNNVRAAVVVRM